MSAAEQIEVVRLRRQQLIEAIEALDTSALDSLIANEWATRGFIQILRDVRDAREVKRMNQHLKLWALTWWKLTLTVSVSVLAGSILVSGCCDEQQRAVYQCADEHARCRAVIDALCETDDAYCPEDERTSPFSRRTPAMGECDQAYEACYLTATTTRTPDRFTRLDGGVL